jgi:hypothetical protein
MSEDVKKKSFCDDCEEEAAACECYPFVLKAEKKIANLERQLKEAKEENGKLEVIEIVPGEYVKRWFI